MTRAKKKATMKARRANPLYCNSLIKQGNKKLLDFIDAENKRVYKYAQYNTRALLDCPFASEGCKAVCYATKGNHQFPNVKASRERSYQATRASNFVASMLYTLNTEMDSRRYKNATMLLRLHESGDFYSLQYLRKWLQIWKYYSFAAGRIRFVMYTKAFAFLLALTKAEKKALRKLMRAGIVVISLSLDDTTTPEQIARYLQLKKQFPEMNTYYCTENVDAIKYNSVCDCANCAKCGKCNNATGETTAVKIHSASENDLKKYRKASRKKAAA